MVTRLFKLRYVEADQMRNVLNQFTSRDSDFQIFPPDTLVISDLGLNMRRLEKLVAQLDQPGGSEEIHIVPVQYAGAQELAQKLTEIFQAQAPAQRGGVVRQLGVAEPVVQPGQPIAVPPPGQAPAGTGGPVQIGKIIPEERTNKLIVIAGARSFSRVMQLIRQLDVPAGEGGVHVYYLENAKAEDVAASAHGGTILNDVSFRGAKGDAPLVVGSELSGLSSVGGVSTLTSLGGFLAGLQGPPITVPGTNISIPSFAILLNALQSSSDVNVISTPHVTMVDNTEGEITVGQNVPFQSGFAPQLSGLVGAQTTGTNTATGAAVGSTLGLGGLGSLFAPIQRQNVELRLRIKPQISASDQVRLEVDEQTEEIASVDKQLGPTTSKRTAKTTVVVKDQETVVLGGLIQERTLKDVKKVPLLGSLPIVGWLCRNETTRKTKTH